METVELGEMSDKVDPSQDKFPFCIVWTPIPVLTWLIPIIGHMGIGLSNGVIRDFAGSYYVAENNMGFAKPVKYWQLSPSLAKGGASGWDLAVTGAAVIYKNRAHNLLCDNCHSFVATALDLMNYKDSRKWNMVKLAFLMLIYSKYVSFTGFLKTWLPFFFIVTVSVIVSCTVNN
ncbi:unnamed protein product [Phyllotreta striolata]|uniref:Transmembrane protein 222 n=1 Tax=Phyllotreta striolata TaxID=444603 RepID=A0A9N9XP35_PHYSR|nr:unnamed protein product [Phyllotreta striolata]